MHLADGGSNMTARIETFRYDDDIVRKFVCATLLWGAVATALGLWIAVLLVAPSLSANIPALSFGRLRPLHTNAAIFAFAGNALFAAVYYSSQRLLKTASRSPKSTRSWSGPSTSPSRSCGSPSQ
jgi:cytochrome c oxidase cbb3-type subunit I/II